MYTISAANRRLKSFQNKLHNITENTNDAASSVPQPDNARFVKDKFRVKQDNKEIGKAQGVDSARVSGRIVTPAASKRNPKGVAPSTNTICKIESISSVHSELDIKDEGPIYESSSANNYVQNNYNPANPQQNYYYVISQNPGIAGGSIIPQGSAPLMQTVQGVAPLPIQQGYYVQPSVPQNYVIQNPTFLPAPQQQQQPVFQQQSGLQIVSTDVRTTTTYVSNNGYVPYVAHNPPSCPQNAVHPRAQNRYSQNSNPPRPILPYPNGAVIRSSSAPIRGGRLRSNPQPVRCNAPSQRMPNSRVAARQKTVQTSIAESSGQKTTSLIVISDSDDEIEMIITEKSPALQKTTETNRVNLVPESRQKPTITSDITVPSEGKSTIPPQILQRMNQGGISITPVKNTPPPQSTNSNTQLVVVVNETGSHYALSLPNGSKLILTPEQVAQIRASNGGKLLL